MLKILKFICTIRTVRTGRILAFLAQSGVQVIVETHSDHIYNGIRKSICQDRIDCEKVCIYSFMQDENGCSIPVRIPVNEDGKALGKNRKDFLIRSIKT